jgi:hypothetical protein
VDNRRVAAFDRQSKQITSIVILMAVVRFI